MVESGEIVIDPIRELSDEDAKKEISKYIQSAGDERFSISGIAGELKLDIERIIAVMIELDEVE